MHFELVFTSCWFVNELNKIFDRCSLDICMRVTFLTFQKWYLSSFRGCSTKIPKRTHLTEPIKLMRRVPHRLLEVRLVSSGLPEWIPSNRILSLLAPCFSRLICYSFLIWSICFYPWFAHDLQVTLSWWQQWWSIWRNDAAIWDLGPLDDGDWSSVWWRERIWFGTSFCLSLYQLWAQSIQNCVPIREKIDLYDLDW